MLGLKEMKKISNTRIDKVIIFLSVILMSVLFINIAVTPVVLVKDRYTTLPYVKQAETKWIRPIPQYKTQELSEEYNDTFIIIHKESR